MLNLVIQQPEPDKVKSDVNVPSGEPTDLEPSETTAETLLTLSPDQEMNCESLPTGSCQHSARRPPRCFTGTYSVSHIGN